MLTTLDKVKRLEQYLAVDNSTVDPVVDLTIDKLLAREREGTQDTDNTDFTDFYLHLCSSVKSVSQNKEILWLKANTLN